MSVFSTGGGASRPGFFVKYIESTGTQYIDLKVVPASGYTAEIGFTATYIPADAESWVISVFDMSATGYPRMRVGIVSGAYYTDTSNGATYTGTPGEYTEATVGVSRSGCKLSLYLFAAHEVNGPAHMENSKYRFYFCRIYDGNKNLIAEFLPYVDESGIACVKNTVNGEKLYNAGTDEFLVGGAA